MPINAFYHTWIMEIRQLRLRDRITRVKNLARLLARIQQSRSIYLSRIAISAKIHWQHSSSLILSFPNCVIRSDSE